VAKKSKDRTKVQAAPITANPETRAGSCKWWIHLIVLLGLFAANFALYHGTVGLGFLSVDDPDYVQNNPYIENFHAENVKYILTKPYAANYAPASKKLKTLAVYHHARFAVQNFVATDGRRL
jgi:hypothetical protein